MDLLLQRALEIANRPRRSQRPAIQPGDLVIWLSPALPQQQGEVLAVHDDGTFEVFVPISEVVRRLPVAWITRNITTAPIQEGPTP
jgi:hypothetical protein